MWRTMIGLHGLNNSSETNLPSQAQTSETFNNTREVPSETFKAKKVSFLCV